MFRDGAGRPVPFSHLGKVRQRERERESIRLVPSHTPGMPDSGALWALLPGTQFERTAVEHHGKAGIGPSASLWDEAREGRIFAHLSQHSCSFCHTWYLRGLLNECVNEQECEQRRARNASPGEWNKYGNSVVSEHVTFKEENGHSVAWKAAVFKQMLWLHSPAAHSSSLPEVSLILTFCAVRTSALLMLQASGNGSF
jgi:hypothetical protein